MNSGGGAENFIEAQEPAQGFPDSGRRDDGKARAFAQEKKAEGMVQIGVGQERSGQG